MEDTDLSFAEGDGHRYGRWVLPSFTRLEREVCCSRDKKENVHTETM